MSWSRTPHNWQSLLCKIGVWELMFEQLLELFLCTIIWPAWFYSVTRFNSYGNTTKVIPQQCFKNNFPLNDGQLHILWDTLPTPKCSQTKTMPKIKNKSKQEIAVRDSVIALLTLFCGWANRCISPGALEEDHSDINLHMG